MLLARHLVAGSGGARDSSAPDVPQALVAVLQECRKAASTPAVVLEEIRTQLHDRVWVRPADVPTCACLLHITTAPRASLPSRTHELSRIRSGSGIGWCRSLLLSAGISFEHLGSVSLRVCAGRARRRSLA